MNRLEVIADRVVGEVQQFASIIINIYGSGLPADRVSRTPKQFAFWLAIVFTGLGIIIAYVYLWSTDATPPVIAIFAFLGWLIGYFSHGPWVSEKKFRVILGRTFLIVSLCVLLVVLVLSAKYFTQVSCEGFKPSHLVLDLMTGAGQVKRSIEGGIELTSNDVRELQNLSGRAVFGSRGLPGACECTWLGRTGATAT